MIGGFVEDEHLRFEVHRPGDGDALALAARELSDQGVRRAQMQVHLGDRADRIVAHFSLIHYAEAAGGRPQRLSSDEEIRATVMVGIIELFW